MTVMLTPDDFRPHVKKTFRVRGGHHAFTLTAVDAPDLGEPTPGARRSPFNLLFTGPPNDVLGEGLYTLEVDGGSSFELYVIPIYTPARDRQDYQAPFN
jgi:hypothetical protein